MEAERFAEAATAAFLSDVARAPGIDRAIRQKGLRGPQLVAIMMRDVARGVRGEPGPALFPNVRALYRTQMNVEEDKLRAGMGQWDAVAAALTAVGNVYATKVTASAQTSIAKVQATTAQQALDLQALQARAALAQAQGFPSATAAPAPGTPGYPGGDGGTPGWVLPVSVGGGILVLLGIGYAVTR